MVRCSELLVTSNNITYLSGNQLQYSIEKKGYIVREFVQFIDIPDMFGEIVTSFDRRLEMRKSAGISSNKEVDDQKAELEGEVVDKQVNHLTVLSNCPGSGKSTAMMHFPLSEAYKSYHRRRTFDKMEPLRVTADPPIVCALTFNSGMEDGARSLGMRILFGTMKAMGCEYKGTWDQFCNDFKDCERVSGLQAVGIVRRLFGEDRLMLIIVDELIKANIEGAMTYDATAMRELGMILNSDGRSDILVSSLSPTYIDTLMTGSNRLIDYIPLRPLPLDQLGMSEFKPFAEAMIGDVERKMKAPINSFCKKLLLNTPALASGHGRSVQLLIQSIKQPIKPMWRKIEYLLSTNDVMTVLSNLADLTFSKYINVPHRASERGLLFLPLLLNVHNNLEFRMMLEGNRGFIYKKDDDDSFKIATTISGMLNTIRSISTVPDADLDAISLALKSLFDPLPDEISEFWERCCDLTLVGRSIVAIENNRQRKFFPVFCSPLRGGSFSRGDRVKLTDGLRVRIMAPDEPIRFEANTLVVPADKKQPGFDSIVFGIQGGNNRKVHAYNEVKITFPANETLLEIVASKLVSVLKFHFEHVSSVDQRTEVESGEEDGDDELKSIFLNFYLYASSVNPMDVSSAELTKQLTKLKKSSIKSLAKYKSSIEEKQVQLAKDVANQYLEVGKQKKLKSRQKAMQVMIEETLPSQCSATSSFQKVVDRAIRFAKLCGDTNINVLNREDMDEWLLPTVVPIATLVQAVQGDSRSS